MVFSLKTLACLQHRLLVLQNAFLMTVVRLASMLGRHLAFKKVTAAYTHGNRHDAFCIVHVMSTHKSLGINGCAFFMCHITWCKCIWCHVEMKRRPTSYRMWATPDIMAPQNTKLKLNTRTWRLASCSAWSECYIVQQKFNRSCTDVEGRHCVRRKHMVRKVENEKKKRKKI